MKKFTLFLLICSATLSYGQNQAEEEVIAVIRKMFDAMRAGDSTALRQTFHPSVRLQTTLFDKEGHAKIVNGDIEKFIAAVGTPHDAVWDERIWSYVVKLEDNLASAWTEYTFYAGEKLSHCGVNAFQLFRSPGGWKIIQITDTRSFENCRQEAEDAVNTLLDNWHQAAAEADEDTFFGSMGEGAIYLGTDASERWQRDEMRSLMKDVFERETAWDFKVKSRSVYFSEDEQMAWFEEALATWMGPCRGSGVLKRTDAGWKIEQYNLTLTIPNEKMESVIRLLNPVISEKKN